MAVLVLVIPYANSSLLILLGMNQFAEVLNSENLDFREGQLSG
jgi:hypothetical protein